jgi:hypothetical protein
MISVTDRPAGGFIGRWVSERTKVLNVPELYRNYSSFETEFIHTDAVRHSMIRGG